MNLIGIFESLLAQHGSKDVALSEFQKMLSDDHELRDAYRLWCEENGVRPSKGFIEFCDLYFDEQESRMGSFSSYGSYD